MATTKSTLYSLPQRAKLDPAFQQWLLPAVQDRLPLNLVDTTTGPYAEGTPPAGLNTATGQSNQDQEIIYKKTSADANVFTLNGTADGPLPEGPLHLNAQYDFFRIKSNGSVWYRVG